MKGNYTLGSEVTKENYQALRSLAKSLSGKEFEKATGFKRGVHNRIKKFLSFAEYKGDEHRRAKKYGSRYVKRAITLKDIYEKLVEIENLIKK